VPLRAAARMGAGLPAPHAAPPRRAGAQEGREFRRQAARRHRPQRPAGHVSRRRGELGDRRAQYDDPPEHGAPGRHPPRGTPAALCRRDVRDPGAPRGRGTQRGGAGLRQAQGCALCDLLRELQQHRHRCRDACRAGQERRRDRGGASGLLRHAQARIGRHRVGGQCGEGSLGGSAAVGRQGLRHNCADAVLRAHAQVRMAADLSQGPGGRAPVERHLRPFRVRGRHRQEARSGAGAGTA